ncbi:MAG TPA: VWA domain-containing protein [Bryobacterales bacterium]|nr:VWA domain-containing protein [Bryobacterales bacterium]
MKHHVFIPALGAVVLAALLYTPHPAPAQQPSKPEEVPNISVEVQVVNVFFTVRDKRGGLVGNLDKSDFTVEEEGRPQEIKYFSRQSDVPLTMGLLVDTSVSQGNLIEAERQASYEFLNQMLRVKKDQSFLISFDINVDLLQDYTDSVRLLRAGLDKLHVNGGAGGFGGGPVPTSGKPRGTLLYDAVFLAANDMLRNQVGRKTLVLITDGNDQGSQTSLKEAVAAAQRADAIIYSIEYLDREFYYRAGGYGVLGGFGSGAALKKMSEETGGRVFEVGRKKTLKMIYDEIQQELRSQYSIGYTPPSSGPSFRHIRIIPKNRELRAQARQGYYAKS